MQYIQPADVGPEYQGLPGLVEFTNDDGQLCRVNCGQAAAATLLHFRDGSASPNSWMACLERDHPPDNLGGWLGTSRRRIERALRCRGYHPSIVRGEEGLKNALILKEPVIVTMQLSAGKFWRFDIPSAHWMVAFGFDREHLYLTNWWDNRITWVEFLKGWHGWVPALTSLRGMGIVAGARGK